LPQLLLSIAETGNSSISISILIRTLTLLVGYAIIAVSLPVTIPIKYHLLGFGMRKKKRTVTIQDVAKTADVSVSTVSRVLNGKVDVASETQDRVR